MNEIFCSSMKFFLGDATKGSVEGYKNLNFFTILEKGIFFISNPSNVLWHFLEKTLLRYFKYFVYYSFYSNGRE
jgi:hypothetical protein